MSVSRSLVSSVCKKIIKPYSPTPTSLDCHKLSFLDQTVDMYIPFAFFYPKLSNTYWSSNVISQHLEKSLSKALPHYYPLAGKLNDNNVSIDCNDNGVEFYTTKIDCPMSKILNDPSSDKDNLVYPKGVPNAYTYDGSLGVFQLSYFNCGGIAVSGCFSHKVFDGYTIGNFMNDWATIARNPSFELPSRQFNGGVSIFPPTKDDYLSNLINNSILPEREDQCLTKTFSFSSSKLAALKVRVINQSQVQNPTDTEVVTALIYQRAMATKKVAALGSFHPSVVSQAMSLRPPLPKSTMGNFFSFFSVITSDEINEMDLPRVVGKLRKEKEVLRQKYKNAQRNEFLPLTLEQFRGVGDMLINNPCCDFYRFTSMIKFPLYDVDFGWGKPEKVSQASNGTTKNVFLLMENKNRDEVDAISCMKEQDMLALERDEEFLQFASPSN